MRACLTALLKLFWGTCALHCGNGEFYAHQWGMEDLKCNLKRWQNWQLTTGLPGGKCCQCVLEWGRDRYLLCIQISLDSFTLVSYMLSCLLFPTITEKAFIALTAWMRKQSWTHRPQIWSFDSKCSAVTLPRRPVRALCSAASWGEQCCLCDRFPEGLQVSEPLPQAYRIYLSRLISLLFIFLQLRMQD